MINYRYTTAFLSMIVIIFITVLFIDQSPNILAIIGATTALASIVFTAFDNYNKTELAREKIKSEEVAKITGDIYSKLFQEKTDAYKLITSAIRKYKNNINSAMISVPYMEAGMDFEDQPTKERFFRESMQEILKILRENELIVSVELYTFYTTINDEFLDAQKGFDEYLEFEIWDPQDYNDTSKNIDKAFYDKAVPSFSSFENILSMEINLLRNKINF